jgi:hypothetical protein
MAAERQWVGRVLGDAWSLVRESDTISWLTTDGARLLKSRDEDHERVIATLRATATTHNLLEKDAVSATRFSAAEAAAQKRLAQWLEHIGGSAGRETGE